MKLTVLCILAVIGLGRCLDHVPTRQEIEASINRTIEEVERKVQADPSLPRLSRQDIVDILRNITTKDLTFGDNKTLEITRNEYQRALMVVLSYNSNGAEDNLKDLYTKPPLVQMISDDVGTDENGKKNVEFTLNEPHLFIKQTSDNVIASYPSPDSTKEPSSPKEHYKNNKDGSESKLSEEPNFASDEKLDSKPERFSFDLETLGKSPATTQRPQRTWKPIVKEVTSSPDNVQASSAVNVVHGPSLSTTETPVSKSTHHVLTSDQWHNRAPPHTTLKSRYHPTHRGFFLPTIQSSHEEKDDQKEKLATVMFKESDAMTFSITETDKPSLIYVTPMSESKPKSTNAFIAGGFLLGSTPPPMRKEVVDLLESIGLQPMKNVDNKANDLTFDKQLVEAKFQIPDTNNVIYNQGSGLTTASVEPASIVDQNTFENTEVDFQKGVDNLTPSVQLLFKKFGLQTSLNAEPSTTTITTIERPALPSYNSYTNFKPLPNSSVRDKEMRDFLARFGLGETRNQKAINPRKNTREERPSLIEAVPGNMKQILENIGLITSNRERNDVNLKKEVAVQTTVATKLHVFKPHETSVFNEQQRAKITELLDTVKKVQRGKANVEDVQKVADEVLETAKSLPDGPDPASLEEILKLYKEDLRNEVKRQQAAEKYEKEVKEENKEEMKEEKKEEEEEKDEMEEKGQEISTFTVASGSIKKFMTYMLGTSELWVGKIIGGLTKMKSFITNLAGKLKQAVSR